MIQDIKFAFRQLVKAQGVHIRSSDDFGVGNRPEHSL